MKLIYINRVKSYTRFDWTKNDDIRKDIHVHYTGHEIRRHKQGCKEHLGQSC
jgi:hypothetical protein